MLFPVTAMPLSWIIWRPHAAAPLTLNWSLQTSMTTACPPMPPAALIARAAAIAPGMLELLSSAAVLKAPIRPIFTALPSLTAEDADPDRPEPPEPPGLELIDTQRGRGKVETP